jgi:glycine C-acetyltransferase
MYVANFKEWITKEIGSIREAGLYKEERIIMGPQGADIKVKPNQEVVNFCANNYLGLSSHPKVLAAARKVVDEWGYGMSSVRFICGTQDIHKILEGKIAKFLGTDDAILYSSCFDANGGVFEPLLDKDCVIITDALNHASIIDGIRLCKATRLIYQHADMADLEAKLKESQNAKFRMIATDGAFSMDGDIAKLHEIVPLAEKYNALTMIDDAHATGFIGKTGRGTPEYRGVMGKIDIINGTLGKALGGSSGGFVASRKEIVELLRQRSRPYLFSNTVSPIVVGASIAIFDVLSETTELRDKLEANYKRFRAGMAKAGFQIPPSDHPICPIMLGQFPNDAKLSQDMARDLLVEGIYVVGFYYPVVPKGKSRIRVQISAGHEFHHIDKAIAAFTKIGKKYGVVK